jgi:hypothetical protein
MIHGEQSLDHSSSSFENISGPNEGENSTTQAVVTADNHAASETKEGVLEQEMEVFRKGEYSRFHASSRVANELEKWEGASDKDKGKAYDSYLTEINSFAAIQDENRSTTREASPPLGTTHISQAEQQSVGIVTGNPGVFR